MPSLSLLGEVGRCRFGRRVGGGSEPRSARRGFPWRTVRCRISSQTSSPIRSRRLLLGSGCLVSPSRSGFQWSGGTFGRHSASAEKGSEPRSARRVFSVEGPSPCHSRAIRCGCGGASTGDSRCLLHLSFLPQSLSRLPGCAGLVPPSGPVVRRFAPIGRYGGHWGVDVAMAPETPVPAMGAGIVSFAGSIAERPVGDDRSRRRTSHVVLLPDRDRGRARRAGEPRSHGRDVRDRPRDRRGASVRPSQRRIRRPRTLVRLRRFSRRLGWRWRRAGAAAAYPARRATRHPRRYVRSAPPRPPLRRRGGLSRSRTSTWSPSSRRALRGRRPAST